MDIQQVFYYMATIAMAMTIVMLFVIIGLLFYVKKKISDLDKYGRNVIQKADTFVEEVKSKARFITNFKSTFLGKSLK